MFEFPGLIHLAYKNWFRNQSTDVRTIWRGYVVLVILSDFVEIILVQLPDETGEVAVLEMLG